MSKNKTIFDKIDEVITEAELKNKPTRRLTEQERSDLVELFTIDWVKRGCPKNIEWLRSLLILEVEK